MSVLRDLIMNEAELGSDDEDEDFDEETGKSNKKSKGTSGRIDDSSEEESEDDEEEERAVSALHKPPLADLTCHRVLSDQRRFHRG